MSSDLRELAAKVWARNFWGPRRWMRAFEPSHGNGTMIAMVGAFRSGWEAAMRSTLIEPE